MVNATAELQTKILVCCDCGEEFVFTADAQRYFYEQRFDKDPKRCKHCHSLKNKDNRHRQ